MKNWKNKFKKHKYVTPPPLPPIFPPCHFHSKWFTENLEEYKDGVKENCENCENCDEKKGNSFMLIQET